MDFPGSWRNVLLFLSDKDAYHWGNSCIEFSVSFQRHLDHRNYLYELWFARHVEALRLGPTFAELTYEEQFGKP